MFCLNFEAHENDSRTLSCCRFAFGYLGEVLPYVFFHLCTAMNGRSWARGGGGGRSFCRLPYRLFFPLRMLYSSSYQCYFVWLVLLEKWTERQNIWVKFSNNEIKKGQDLFIKQSCHRIPSYVLCCWRAKLPEYPQFIPALGLNTHVNWTKKNLFNAFKATISAMTLKQLC